MRFTTLTEYTGNCILHPRNKRTTSANTMQCVDVETETNTNHKEEEIVDEDHHDQEEVNPKQPVPVVPPISPIITTSTATEKDWIMNGTFGMMKVAVSSDQQISCNEETTPMSTQLAAEDDNNNNDDDCTDKDHGHNWNDNKDANENETTHTGNKILYSNLGLTTWEENRRHWLGHENNVQPSIVSTLFQRKNTQHHAVPLPADEIIDVIFASSRQSQPNGSGGGGGGGTSLKFPQPVRLPQMVDILQDLWEAEGLDM